jgi:hypothetical protein
MGLVVATHFREDPGNVVAPTGKNVADNLINALGLHAEFKT